MRQMATIRRIDEINPIDGADAIEVATVGGWKVVVKKGEFSAGELAVYCEIDSWIPNDVAPFLTKPGHPVKEYEGIPGARWRTVKLRGQLSQGLLIPLSIVWTTARDKFVAFDWQSDWTDDDVVGMDVSEGLGIIKYEPPMPACLGGMAKGNFPTAVPKTDQERVQNMKKEVSKMMEEDFRFELTEKLDGSSCTFYLDSELVLHVCSRNLDLTETEGNSFWQMANKYAIAEKMKALGLVEFAIQGELVGPGIQGNKYNLSQHDFFVFDMYDVAAGRYLTSMDRVKHTNELGLNHTPILFTSLTLTQFNDIETILRFAEGKSVLHASTEREGIVFKCHDIPSVSFKAISNRFLLKGGD